MRLYRCEIRRRRFVGHGRPARGPDGAGDWTGRRHHHHAVFIFATAACIARVGATPLFVDIDPATFNISAAALRSFIEKNCRQTDGVLMTRERQAVRLIIPVHLFGLCCDMDAIMEIARECDLLVVEDAAQAIGAGYPQTDGTGSAGTIGDVGCLSFYPSKNLGAAGDAGAIICDNENAGDALPNLPPTWNGTAILPSIYRRKFPAR